MKNKLAWLEAALVMAPFIALVVFWNQIPERVPIHWNIRGEIDGWSTKTTGMLLLPLVAVGTIILCRVLSSLDPKLRKNLQKTDRMKDSADPRSRIRRFFQCDFCGSTHRRIGLQSRCPTSDHLVHPHLLRDSRKLPSKFATELFHWYSHALDAARFGYLAGHPSAGRQIDVLRLAASLGSRISC